MRSLLLGSLCSLVLISSVEAQGRDYKQHVEQNCFYNSVVLEVNEEEGVKTATLLFSSYDLKDTKYQLVLPSNSEMELEEGAPCNFECDDLFAHLDVPVRKKEGLPYLVKLEQ